MSARSLFVPGRLCLFGEHSDWAGLRRAEDPGFAPGRCIVAGTDQGLRSTAGPSPDGLLEVRQIGPDGIRGPWRSYPADAGELERMAASGAFDAYVLGTASVVMRRSGALGLRLDVRRRTLPLGRGLSSSASVCVTAARAFDRVHGLGLTLRGEMELAYLGERLTGSECGRMDQACALGGGPALLTFDGPRMDVEPLRADRDVHILVVDLRASKDTRRILSDLNAAFAAGAPGLREALGPVNLGIVDAARKALESGDAEGLGRLMTEAQSVFDRMVAPCSPGELSAPVLHAVLAHAAATGLAWGGKGVGSQGDGTAQLVCRGRAERAELAVLLRRDLGVGCLDLTVRGAGIRRRGRRSPAG